MATKTANWVRALNSAIQVERAIDAIASADIPREQRIAYLRLLSDTTASAEQRLTALETRLQADALDSRDRRSLDYLESVEEWVRADRPQRPRRMERIVPYRPVVARPDDSPRPVARYVAPLGESYASGEAYNPQKSAAAFARFNPAPATVTPRGEFGTGQEFAIGTEQWGYRVWIDEATLVEEGVANG